MRVLDEIADAIHAARGGYRRRVMSGGGLEEQFGHPIPAWRWVVLKQRLGCPLPPVKLDQGHWWLPDELVTIWDLAAHVARCRPEWEPPAEQTTAAWREAQVFAGVREVIVDAGSLKPAKVVRPARLGPDLRLE